tara:strand:+ start:715 stop:1020 length:306 start_codon:yes stop_codon:yes gene_type:complete
MLNFLKNLFSKSSSSKLPQNNEVYIGNIDYRVSYHELKTFFSNCGEIESLKLIKDAQTGRSKGFGFVKFNTVKEARKAVKLNGLQLKSRKILVTFAKKREQ